MQKFKSTAISFTKEVVIPTVATVLILMLITEIFK